MKNKKKKVSGKNISIIVSHNDPILGQRFTTKEIQLREIRKDFPKNRKR